MHLPAARQALGLGQLAQGVKLVLFIARSRDFAPGFIARLRAFTPGFIARSLDLPYFIF